MGHARDYCVAMWKILQQNQTLCYCTGKQHSIKQFINMTVKRLKMKINGLGKEWRKRYWWKWQYYNWMWKNYFRPLDVNTLLVDARRARKELQWTPKENIISLIDEMVKFEINSINANQ